MWLANFFGVSGAASNFAPYEFIYEGGPDIRGEIAKVVPYSLKDNRVEVADVTDAEKESLQDTVFALAQKFCFHLQNVGGKWFFTRRNAWGVRTRPIDGVCAFVPTSASFEDNSNGDFANFLCESQKLLAAHPVNIARSQEGRLPIEGFWITGASVKNRIRPTAVRAVFANDTYVRGLACAALIGKDRAVGVTDAYPNAPEGDALVVIDDFVDAYRRADWAAWEAKLPGAVAAIEEKISQAVTQKISEVLLCATGKTTARNVRFTLKSTFGMIVAPKARDFELHKMIRETL